MPWSQTSPMDQRTQFIADYLREVFTITELCDLYSVSRKTGINGSTAICAPDPPVSKSGLADPGCRRTPRPRRLSRPSRKRVAAILRGAPRSFSRLSLSVIHAGTCQAVPRSATS